MKNNVKNKLIDFFLHEEQCVPRHVRLAETVSSVAMLHMFSNHKNVIIFVPYPHYSPDLAPWNFVFPPKMKPERPTVTYNRRNTSRTASSARLVHNRRLPDNFWTVEKIIYFYL